MISGKKPMTEDIATLVKEAKRGDSEAFGYVYEEFFAPIYRYVYYRVKSKQDAEDLSQTAFLKAWKALSDYTEKGHGISSWFYKIARNSIIDYWKKEGRRKDVDFEMACFNISDDKDLREIIEKRELSEIVKEAIGELTEEQQEVVIMRFVEGFSVREVAGIMEKSEEAIRALQCRGLKVLRVKLKKVDL